MLRVVTVKSNLTSGVYPLISLGFCIQFVMPLDDLDLDQEKISVVCLGYGNRWLEYLHTNANHELTS